MDMEMDCSSEDGIDLCEVRRSRACKSSVSSCPGASLPKKKKVDKNEDLNVEEIYRQLNEVKTRCTSLETIYEYPKNSKDPRKCLMSAMRTKRSCMLSDYYNPSKVKIKARKERAKRLKRRGVKVPTGAEVTTEQLEAILNKISDDEENISNNSEVVGNNASFNFFTNKEVKLTAVKHVPLVQGSFSMPELCFEDNSPAPTLPMQDEIHEASLGITDESEEIIEKPRRRKGRRSGCGKDLFPPSYCTSKVFSELVDLKEENMQEIVDKPITNNLAMVEERSEELDVLEACSQENKIPFCVQSDGIEVSIHKKSDCSTRTGTVELSMDLPAAKKDSCHGLLASSGVGTRRSKRRASGVCKSLYGLLSSCSLDSMNDNNHSDDSGKSPSSSLEASSSTCSEASKGVENPTPVLPSAVKLKNRKRKFDSHETTVLLSGQLQTLTVFDDVGQVPVGEVNNELGQVFKDRDGNTDNINQSEVVTGGESRKKIQSRRRRSLRLMQTGRVIYHDTDLSPCDVLSTNFQPSAETTSQVSSTGVLSNSDILEEIGINDSCQNLNQQKLSNIPKISTKRGKTSKLNKKRLLDKCKPDGKPASVALEGRKRSCQQPSPQHVGQPPVNCNLADTSVLPDNNPDLSQLTVPVSSTLNHNPEPSKVSNQDSTRPNHNVSSRPKRRRSVAKLSAALGHLTVGRNESSEVVLSSSLSGLQLDPEVQLSKTRHPKRFFNNSNDVGLVVPPAEVIPANVLHEDLNSDSNVSPGDRAMDMKKSPDVSELDLGSSKEPHSSPKKEEWHISLTGTESNALGSSGKCISTTEQSSPPTKSLSRHLEPSPRHKKYLLLQSKSSVPIAESSVQHANSSMPIKASPSLPQSSQSLRQSSPSLAQSSLSLAQPSQALPQSSPPFQQLSPFLQQLSPSLQQLSPSLQQLSPSLQQLSPSLQQLSPSLQQSSPPLLQSSPSLPQSPPSLPQSSQSLPQPSQSLPQPSQSLPLSSQSLPQSSQSLLQLSPFRSGDKPLNLNADSPLVSAMFCNSLAVHAGKVFPNRKLSKSAKTSQKKLLAKFKVLPH